MTCVYGGSFDDGDYSVDNLDITIAPFNNWMVKTVKFPRCPELTPAAQAPLQLQLNCCHTGSSTAAACCHKGCPQRLRYRKWARGSRSLTHRRAVMGGFTVDDG